jgi:hypothetical protein
MKTTISNQSTDIVEIANQVIYSAKVLAIGLFIPFLFVFGISYHTNNPVNDNPTSISKAHKAVSGNNATVDLGKVLSNQNS